MVVVTTCDRARHGGWGYGGAVLRQSPIPYRSPTGSVPCGGSECAHRSVQPPAIRLRTFSSHPKEMPHASASVNPRQQLTYFLRSSASSGHFLEWNAVSRGSSARLLPLFSRVSRVVVSVRIPVLAVAGTHPTGGHTTVSWSTRQPAAVWVVTTLRLLFITSL